MLLNIKNKDKISDVGDTSNKFKIRSILIVLLSFFTLSSFSQIAYVEGVQTSHKTWVKDTTYVIFKDVTFPAGVKLTIEAGTTVKINYNLRLIIDNGIFEAVGTVTDSIRFVANHSHPGQFWKWSGLVIKNIGPENQSYISHVYFEEAETAVTIEEAQNIIIQNSSMTNCQNMGIDIHNSSRCFIVNCVIENNYNGIELFSGSSGNTSNNLILNTILKNENHNIYILREAGGLYKNNIMSNNLIADGTNGIWIDNYGGSVDSENVISKNIIINNGSDVGYGIFLAHDSTIVTNNIFWKNNIAIYSENKGNSCSILENSFYNNSFAISIGSGSTGNKIFNNTFSLNDEELLGIKEITKTGFYNNNLVNNYDNSNIIVNKTFDDITLPNNYWGTISETRIQELIYDHNDNPDLGYVYFEPVSQVNDTTNPISPPYNPKKQLINNIVYVSWNSNEEEDLHNYNIYYGAFYNYNFESNDSVGLDTSYALTMDISIYDEIAVTASDFTNTGTNSQLTGHESPFAFAVLYPFAGKDTIICQYQQQIKMIESNIPFAFEEFYWKTTGDGVFDDHLTLDPTYFPGEEDIHNGEVILSLVAITETDTIIDSFRLGIIEDPFSFAGNDTIIVADTGLKLINAVASNYQNVRWLTNGDGYFLNDTIVNTVYYPGDIDSESGVVLLELIAFSECGTAIDSLMLIIEPHFSIEGKLWTDQKSPYQGVVVAFIVSNNGTRATLLESTKSDGTFRFPKVMKGNYYIYALPDTNNNEYLVPGYYANKYRWQPAYLLPVYADVYDIDIYLSMVDFILPPGEASISGHMNYPESSLMVGSIYCSPWFTDNGDQICIGGLSNNSILLFNPDKTKLLDYTLTDDLGDFYFNDIPYGSYVVDAEKAGFNSIPSPVIVLSPEHINESDVKINFDNKKIAITVDSPYPVENAISVYPNPASHELTIPIIDSGWAKIQIFNVYGNIVVFENVLLVDGQKSVIVNLSQIPAGLYFGLINNQHSNSKFSFIRD